MPDNDKHFMAMIDSIVTTMAVMRELVVKQGSHIADLEARVRELEGRPI